MNAIGNVAGSAPIVVREAKPLDVPKQSRAELMYHDFADIGLEQPRCKRLDTGDDTDGEQQASDD